MLQVQQATKLWHPCALMLHPSTHASITAVDESIIPKIPQCRCQYHGVPVVCSQHRRCRTRLAMLQHTLDVTFMQISIVQHDLASSHVHAMA